MLLARRIKTALR